MPDRQYDVVLYGASGFTGRQTVQYFANLLLFQVEYRAQNSRLHIHLLIRYQYFVHLVPVLTQRILGSQQSNRQINYILIGKMDKKLFFG